MSKPPRIIVKLKGGGISSAGEIHHPITTMLAHNTMIYGRGYSWWSRKWVRCIMWREDSQCRYIMVGHSRGKVVPVMRFFEGKLHLNEDQQKKWKANVRAYQLLIV